MQTFLLLAFLVVNPQPKGRIEFTIDDGPQRASAPKILALFESYCIRTTWFIAGFHLGHPESRKILRTIAEKGHYIANHLWSHKPPCKVLGVQKVLRELDRTDKNIRWSLKGSPGLKNMRK